MPDKCAFCPSTATLTGEHLWSDWINNIVPEATYEFKRVDLKTKKESTWTDYKLKQKTRVACHDCNHGWMSKLENKEAKPSLMSLITDTSPRIVPIRSLISIGIFLFKTAVVADHMDTGGSPFFTVEERYTFRETLSVPSGLSMWIGALEDNFRGAFKTLHAMPVATTENDFGMYVFTYIVGHLVLQLVGSKWSAHNLRLPAKQRDSDSAYMTWFWPIVSSIQWPPQKYIPVGYLDKISDRWKTFKLTRPHSNLSSES